MSEHDGAPATGPEAEFGRTSGGGGAAGLKQDWPNPAIGMFDQVDNVPGAAKPDAILVAEGVARIVRGPARRSPSTTWRSSVERSPR